MTTLSGFLRLLVAGIILGGSTTDLLSQPLSGSFTVGGTAPDFASPQAAADALKARGVSGPVFLNLRPGTYTRDGGTSPVLILDSTVTGVSPTNRITFQPDEATGGTADNIILQVDEDTLFTNLAAVRILVDYVTLRNLTFKDDDSLDVGATYLLEIDGNSGQNPSVEGLIVEGCTFLGNLNNTIDADRGTDYGIHADDFLADAVIRGNAMIRLRRAISISFDDASDLGGTYVVEDNEILSGHLGVSGSGNPLGGGIQVGGTSVTVRRNVVDFAGGNGSAVGISVRIFTSGKIEQNLVKNAAPPSPPPPFFFVAINVEDYFFHPSDSVLVANNMVLGTTHPTRSALLVQANNTRVIHNTILQPFGVHVFNPSWCLVIGAEDCTVLNNIAIDFGTNVGVTVYDQSTFGNAAGLVSDFNIFFGAPDGNLVRDFNSTYHQSLADYQAATGLDTNSHEKEVSFLDLSQDLHIDDCQAQDPDLAGIPVPDVVIDHDGDLRSTVNPTIGADEGSAAAHDLFGDVFRLVNHGAAFSADAGLVNNIVAANLVVPEWDSSRVNVLNYSNPRQYVFGERWPTNACRPTVVKVVDMDLDGNRDIVIACSGSPLTVYYLDGSGLSGQVEEIGTSNTRSLEIADVNIDGLPDIVATQGDPVAYVNDNGRGNFVPHQLANASAATGDLMVKDLNGDDDPDILVINESPLPPSISVYINLGVNGGIWDGFGGETEYQFQADGSTDASSIADGDFDSDGDTDLVLTHAASDSLVFLINNGNATFERETVLDRDHRAVASLDYDNDGDVDLAVAHFSLSEDGFTIFFNEGNGSFVKKQNCFVSTLVNGVATGLAAKYLDFDDLPDLIITTVDTAYVLFNLGGGPTAVNQTAPPEAPESFALLQNYPNPFNPSTTIEYELPGQSRVILKVYDLLGREVTTLIDEIQAAGVQTLTWQAGGVSSGVYFYRLQATTASVNRTYTSVKKMIVIK